LKLEYGRSVVGEGSREGGGEEASKHDDHAGDEEEEARVGRAAEMNECRAGDGTDAPADIEEGQGTGAVRAGGTGDDIAGSEPGGDSEASSEEGEVGGGEVSPGEGKGSCCAENCSREEAEP